MKLDAVTAQHIIEQISPSLATDIWIVDHSSHILASSQPKSAHLQTKLPEANQTAQSKHYLRLPLCHGDKEVAILVIAGTDRQNQEAAHIAKTLAELIIYQTAVFEQLVDRQLALNKFVYHLLHHQVQDNPTLVLQEASLLQLDLSIPRVAVVFDLNPLFAQSQADHSKSLEGAPSHLSQFQQLRRRLLQQMSEQFPEKAANLYAFPDEHWLVVLAVIDSKQPEKWRQPLKRVVQATIERCKRIIDVEIRAGIGDYYPNWQSLITSYDDACFALQVGSTLYEAEQVFTITDLGLAAFVCAEDPTVSTKLTTRLLAPLLAEPELFSTLETFLELNLSPSQAAQKLAIHRHTLTYRLQKITELTGADPRNFQDATQFMAALLWHKCKQPVT